jgi:hypothetical protein
MGGFQETDEKVDYVVYSQQLESQVHRQMG